MVSIETPVEIKLSLGNPIYRGPQGKTPVKGVDYFTQEDINDIVAQIEGGEGIDLSSYATKVYVDEAVESIEIPETDLTDYATKIYVDSAIEGVVVEETDPTVPSWAKQASKPTYTAQEVGALPANTALFSGDYNDLSNKPTIPVVPTNVSSFTNDAGYLTTHQSLTDYATKSYVETAIRGAESGLLKRSVVQALPVSDIDEDTIYMVAKTGSTGDVYDEYLYVNSNWEHIGSTDVDLTNYRKVIKLNSTSNLSDEDKLFLQELLNYYTILLDNEEITRNTKNYIVDYALFINGQSIDYCYINRDNYDSSLYFYSNVVDNSQGLIRFVFSYRTQYPNKLYSSSSQCYLDNAQIYQSQNQMASNVKTIGNNFKYIKDNYVKTTDMPEYLTNTDILAIWNGNNE